MKLTAINKPFLYYLIIFLIPIINLSLMTTNFGIGITPDSVNYLSASNSFIANGSFVEFNGQPLSHWPPLFPIILSIISVLEIDPLSSMININGVILGITSIMSFYFVRSVTQSNIYALVTGLLVSTGPPLMYISSKLWSEPLFTLLTFSTIILLVKYLKSSLITMLVFLGTLCSLAFLQRYAGVTLILTSSVIIFKHSKELVRTRIFHITIFGIIACTPVSIWIIRNLINNATVSGERFYSISKLYHSTKLAFSEIGSFIIPKEFILDLQIIDKNAYSIVVFGVGLTIIVYAFYITTSSLLITNKKTELEQNIISLFIIVYFFFIIYALLTACCVQRLFAPIYPMIIIFFVISIYRLLEKYNTEHKEYLFSFLLITFIFLASNIYSNVKSILEFNEKGFGITGKTWKNKSLINYLNKLNNKSDTCIYSNGAFEIFFHTNIKCVRFVAMKKPYYHDIQIDTRSKIINTIRKENKQKILFVWFNNLRENRFYDIESIKLYFETSQLFKSSDGSVYEIIVNE